MKLKEKIKVFFGDKGIRWRKDFNFEEHLVEAHNFTLNQSSDTVNIYTHNSYNFMLIVNFNESIVSVILKKSLVSRLNFIPNSEMFSDIYINLTIQKLTSGESV